MTLTLPSEENEQAALVQYLDMFPKQIKYTAIPNSTYTKSWSQKTKNTRTGLRPGFPDLFLLINNQAVCIEMKRLKGGVVSQAQKDWIAALNISGVPTFVCNGFDEAKVIVDKYLIQTLPPIHIKIPAGSPVIDIPYKPTNTSIF